MTDPQSPWSDPTKEPTPPPQWAASAPVYPPPPPVSAVPDSGYTYYQQPVAYQPNPYTQYQPIPPNNGLAIASMIMAIIGFGPIAAIMGHIARGQIRSRGESGEGFALAGIIVGWATTAIWLLLCGGFLLLGLSFGALGMASGTGS
jgi:hypothetical protein